jgi:prolipoprotein diacylglyceryltransferase
VQFKTPDITPAQIIAIVGAIIGVAVAAGLNISQDLQDSIIRLVTILAPVLIVGDGVVRHGRATGNANKS